MRSRRPLPDPRTRPRAFTLTEIAIVIAVVALLVGLTVPALSRASAAGRSARCLSNLRQMTFAAQQYANVYDAWPAAVLYENDGVHTTIAWDWVQTMGGEILGPGPLWAFTDDPGSVMQCPEFFGETNFADPFTGYNYNASYIGDMERWTFDGAGAVRRGTPPHACSRAGRCAMFGDGGWIGGTNKFMRAPANHESAPINELYAGGQAYRHLDGTNAAYVDCHVATVQGPRPGIHATDELLETVMGYPENGFLSDDDAAYDPR